MNYQGVVRNFGQYTQQQLEQMKTDLGLTVSLDTLLFCATHYRVYERRDPYIDELRMIDALSQALETDVNALTPTEFLTNDSFVAETYADLLHKRKLLNPNVTYPCTLAEATKIAPAYIFRAGKQSALRCASYLPETVSENTARVDTDCVCAPNSAFRLRLLPFSGDAPAVGDLLILTSPQNGQPQTAFERVLETLLRKDTLQAALRGVYTVRKSGLMRELTEITNSAWIDLTRFSPLGLSMPMTVLTDQYGGSRILRVSSKAAATVLNACSTAGLQAFVFAAVTANGKMTFSRDAKNHFSISTQFLRMIFHYQSVSAKLADERQLSADPISHRTVVGANCAYLSTGNAQNASEVSAVNGVLCAASSAVPTRAFFKTALYTTLAPIVTLAAHGADYTAEILTLGLEIPEKHTNPHAVGEIMSTILGAYRVQAELGIAAQATPIRTAPDRSHPSLSAFALTNGMAKPSTLTAEDNEVYLLMPQIFANGLPDFDALRKWLEALSNLSRQGVICSCRTLVGEAVTDGICKMSGTYTCRITDTAIASEEKLPLAVLIESKQDLPFRRVGTVKKAEIPPEDIPPCFAHQHASLIWSEAPEVVIVASKHDSDAAVLASVLERRGCTVHSFSDREDESDPLSRAILGAQYCLICGSACLPQSSKMKFAISTMKRAGGLLLSLGEKGDPSDSSVCLPNGLTEEILQKICSSNQKIAKKS